MTNKKVKQLKKIKMQQDMVVNNSPNFISTRGNQKWVDYKTADNKQQYPDMLIDLKTNSSYHGSVLDTKIRLVGGKGFKVDDEATLKFLSMLNGDGEDMNDILPQLAYDLEIFGAFALQVIWNTNWTKISEIRYVAVDKLRAGTVDKTGKIPNYYFSYDWDQYTPECVREIPTFNFGVARTKAEEYDRLKTNYLIPEVATFKAESNSQIFYYKIKNGKSFYYPLPPYSGLINSIIGDIGADQYIANGLKVGFAPQVLINITGEYDEEGAAEAVSIIKENYMTGLESNLAMIDIAPTKEEALTVTAIPNTSKEDRFLSISQSSKEKILAGHKIPSIIACVETAGKLGNRDEIENSYEFFHSSVIKPDQERITKVINKLLAINGLKNVTIDKRELFETDEMENTSELDSDMNVDEEVEEVIEIERNDKTDNIPSIVACINTSELDSDINAGEEVAAVIDVENNL